METKVGMHLKSLSKSIFHIPTSSLKSHFPPLFSTHDTFCTFFNTQNMKSKHFWPIWSFGSLNNGSNWISRLQTKFSSYIPRKFTNYILLLSRIKALYWYLEGPPNKYSYQVWFLLSKVLLEKTKPCNVYRWSQRQIQSDDNTPHDPLALVSWKQSISNNYLYYSELNHFNPNLCMFLLVNVGLGFGLWCLTPLSTIFQLYCGGQLY